MTVFSKLFLYVKYHFFEVKVLNGSSLKYHLWALNRLFKYTLKGESECGYYLPLDLEVENSFGKFYLPKNTDLVLTISSKSENNLLRYFHLENQKGTFLDIGANAGKYSIMIGNQFPDSKIYAFEPNPTTFKILKKNIELNDLNTRVKPFNIGISDSEGKLSFSAVNQNTGLSRIVPDGEAFAGELNIIPVKSVDEIALENSIDPKEIKLVKIDVEGHEYEVVVGAKNTFQEMKSGSRILIEIHPNAPKKLNILETITGYGFQCQQLDIEYFIATKVK